MINKTNSINNGPSHIEYIDKLECLIFKEFPIFLEGKKLIRKKLIFQNKSFKSKSKYRFDIKDKQNQLNRINYFSNNINNNIINFESTNNSLKFYLKNQILTNYQTEGLNKKLSKNKKLFNNYTEYLKNYKNLFDHFENNSINSHKEIIKKNNKKEFYKEEINIEKFFFCYLNSRNNIDINIPKGIFVYPLEEVKRTKDSEDLQFIPLFKNFDHFDDVIAKIKDEIQEWFYEIPKNYEDSEKIFNREFLVFCFFKSLFYYIFSMYNVNPQLKVFSFEIDQISNYIINTLSKIVDKNIKKIVDIIEIYTNMLVGKMKNNNKKFFYKDKNDLIKKSNQKNYSNFFSAKKEEPNSSLQKNNNYFSVENYNEFRKDSNPNKLDFMSFLKDLKINKNKKFSNIRTYRNSYCNICFTYFCSYHFCENTIPNIFEEYSTEERRFEKEFSTFQLRKITRLKNKYLDLFYDNNFNLINEKLFDAYLTEINLINKKFIDKNKYFEDEFICANETCKNDIRILENFLIFVKNPLSIYEFKKLMRKFYGKDIYYIYLFSDLFYNGCFLNKLIFNYKYPCKDIQNILDSFLLFRNSDDNIYLNCFSQYIQEFFRLSDDFINRNSIKLCDEKGNYIKRKKLIDNLDDNYLNSINLKLLFLNKKFLI